MYHDIARITDLADDETLVRADTKNEQIILRVTELDPPNQAYAVYSIEQARDLIKALQHAIRLAHPLLRDEGPDYSEE